MKATAIITVLLHTAGALAASSATASATNRDPLHAHVPLRPRPRPRPNRHSIPVRDVTALPASVPTPPPDSDNIPSWVEHTSPVHDGIILNKPEMERDLEALPPQLTTLSILLTDRAEQTPAAVADVEMPMKLGPMERDLEALPPQLTTLSILLTARAEQTPAAVADVEDLPEKLTASRSIVTLDASAEQTPAAVAGVQMPCCRYDWYKSPECVPCKRYVADLPAKLETSRSSVNARAEPHKPTEDEKM